jgi:hypothetical protein
MRWNRIVFLLIFCCAASDAYAADCNSSSSKKINLDLWSTRSLLSPDRQWRFIGMGPNSSEQEAALYIENLRTSEKWKIGSIERNGTAFWSEDSKRLFLRDEFAADDTRIRVFDLTGARPKEIEGLDDKIRRATFARIPKNETTLWLYYPKVCFAANDSATVIVVADAPVALASADSRGKSFRVKLTANLITLRVVSTGPKAPTFP